MADLTPFHFESQDVRIHIDASNEPWWVLTDTCSVLGLTNPSEVVKRLKTGTYFTLRNSDTGHSGLIVINEKALYRVIFRSNKDEAQRFQDWVFDEVLPQIRKTGGYVPPPVVTVDPRIEKYPELRAINDLLLATAEARDLAELAHQEAAEAKGMARLAMHGQEWLSIRQYVAIYGLERQMPAPQQKIYGPWLTQYCAENNSPVYELTPVDRPWKKENTYHSVMIKKTLLAWLSRREGQGNLLVLPVERGDA